MPLNAVSDQGLHYLPLIQQFFETSNSNKLDLFKFYGKYGKMFQYSG